MLFGVSAFVAFARTDRVCDYPTILVHSCCNSSKIVVRRLCVSWSRVGPIVISVVVHIVVYFQGIELSESFEARHYASSLAVCTIMLWPIVGEYRGYRALSYLLRAFPRALNWIGRRRQDRRVQYRSERAFLAIGVYVAVSIGGVVVAIYLYKLTLYALAISLIPVGLLYRLVASVTSNILTTRSNLLSLDNKLHNIVFHLASLLVPILSLIATSLGKFIVETFGIKGWVPLILGSVLFVTLVDKWLRGNGPHV